MDIESQLVDDTYSRPTVVTPSDSLFCTFAGPRKARPPTSPEFSLEDRLERIDADTRMSRPCWVVVEGARPATDPCWIIMQPDLESYASTVASPSSNVYGSSSSRQEREISHFVVRAR